MSIIFSEMPAGVTRAHEGEHLNVLGNTLVYKSPSEETQGTAFIWETESLPGSMVPPHIHHTEDEFIYLVEGELSVTIGEDTYAVQPGDLVKMPRNIPHAILSTGTVSAKSLWTVIPAGKMEGLFRALAALPADQPPDPVQIAQIFTAHNIQLLLPPA
jgi:quercetin dioxygenase-like cupin family protein